MNICPNCHRNLKLVYKLKFSIYKCEYCKLQIAKNATFEHSLESNLNEFEREIALKNLRNTNFKKIVSYLQSFFKENLTCGLEIGSGNGWFLDICKEYNIKCIGIEPEKRFNPYFEKSSHTVFNGFYPDIINDIEKYDFIIYNDVLEHIPDINNTIKANHKHLKNSGLLVINIPVSNGIFYKLSVFLYYLGLKSFLNRMWQFNFHSPHLYYFTKNNLIELIQKSGFYFLELIPLKVIGISQIKNRINQDNSINRLKLAILTFFTIFIVPLSKLKTDTYCYFFKKINSEQTL